MRAFAVFRATVFETCGEEQAASHRPVVVVDSAGEQLEMLKDCLLQEQGV